MGRNRYPIHPILIVDDEPDVLSALSGVLTAGGFNNIVTCANALEVMGVLAAQEIEVLLLDLNMPYLSGTELLPQIRAEYPALPVIIISGVTEVALAVECMKLGVFDYLVKAIEKSKLLATVGRAIEIGELQRENTALKRHLVGRQLTHPEAFTEIVSRDEGMRALLMYVDSIAESQQTVLITGETGVGKELIARAIHIASERRGDLVTVNVSGYDEAMFADALFGHLKGAYTSAEGSRSGLVEKAENGTLFLDEIGDLRKESQIKLLRLMESGEYYPLGSDVPRRTNTRMVVATNRALDEEVSLGNFRKDLYYRLKTHHMVIPPLRDRMGDLPLLVGHFVKMASMELGRELPEIPPKLFELLESYSFPGNIRELRSMIFDAMSRHSQGPLSLESFYRTIGETASVQRRTAPQGSFESSEKLPTIKESTLMLVAEAMKRASGNRSLAARMLGITPQALSQRLKRRK